MGVNVFVVLCCPPAVPFPLLLPPPSILPLCLCPLPPPSDLATSSLPSSARSLIVHACSPLPAPARPAAAAAAAAALSAGATRARWAWPARPAAAHDGETPKLMQANLGPSGSPGPPQTRRSLRPEASGVMNEGRMRIGDGDSTAMSHVRSGIWLRGLRLKDLAKPGPAAVGSLEYHPGPTPSNVGPGQ
eukprot:6111766-Pyramimonas_sp.AAC.1